MYNDSKEEHISITVESINSVGKPDIFSDDELNERVQNMCKDLLSESSDDPPFTERAYSISLKELQGKAENISKAKGDDGDGTVNIPSLNESYISIHNHPSGGTFSGKDVKNFLLDGKEKAMIVVGNNGAVYLMIKGPTADTTSALPIVNAYLNGMVHAKSENDFWKELGKYGIEYREYK